MKTTVQDAASRAMAPDELARLFEYLTGEGYSLIGPTLRDGAVVFDHIHCPAGLPRGVRALQTPGSCRLDHNGGGALFAHGAGADSFKRHVSPPRETIWIARRDGEGALTFGQPPQQVQPAAYVGMRPCDLAALLIRDRALAQGEHRDTAYVARRAGLFIAVAECAAPAGNCFCASMGTGPGANRGYDLALTEIGNGGRRMLLIRSGSARGVAVLDALNLPFATTAQLSSARRSVETAAASMRRGPTPEGARAALNRGRESPRWRETAKRCLACGSCAMVCPTCFCHAVEDRAGLDQSRAERVKTWAPCFTREFTYIHGGVARPSVAARYRHWITHKFASWFDQFGVSGCVGCGRCVTWCPVGIDVVEEIAALGKAPDR